MTFPELVESARGYLAVFDYDHYPDAFARFEADAKPLFDGLAQGDAEALAADLIRALSERRASLSRREQRDAAEEQKRVLSLFLSPAAQRHSPAAGAFAEALRAQWCAAYPRNGYLVGSYEQILKGFDANLLGLPLRKSKKLERGRL